MSSQFSPPGSPNSATPIASQQSLAQTQKQIPQLMALESAGVGTWSWNLETDQVICDSRFKSLIGIPPNEPGILRMSSILSHLQVADLELTRAGMKESLETGAEYHLVCPIAYADNTIHWVRIKGGSAEKGRATEICGIGIDVTWAKEVQQEQLQTKTLLAALQKGFEIRAMLLDLVSDATFVFGMDQRVSFWNTGAQRLYGWTSSEALGLSPHDLLKTQYPIPLSDILRAEHWEGELRHTARNGTAVTVHSRWAKVRDPERNAIAWLEINTDLTAQRTAERAAMHLSSRVLKLQDEERRKIGRELHDCLGQYLTALKINLIALNQPTRVADEQRNWAECVSDCLAIVEECLKGTRTLSHLLHPPLLDEIGFASSARWFVEEFARRSGLFVYCDVAPDVSRFGHNAELCFFRVLQESITNAHRHSGCRAVNVIIQADPTTVTLTVKDDGKGIPPDRLKQIREGTGPLGIGLTGMKERVYELGGHLSVDSSEHGTTVTAVVPIALKATSADAEDASSTGIVAA